MDKKIILNIVKSYFCNEISNYLQIFEDSLILLLENGDKIKISVR